MICVWHAKICVWHAKICVWHAKICVWHVKICVWHAKICVWHAKIWNYSWPSGPPDSFHSCQGSSDILSSSLGAEYSLLSTLRSPWWYPPVFFSSGSAPPEPGLYLKRVSPTDIAPHFQSQNFVTVPKNGCSLCQLHHCLKMADLCF